jgi:hypothetical protein
MLMDETSSLCQPLAGEDPGRGEGVQALAVAGSTTFTEGCTLRGGRGEGWRADIVERGGNS